MKKKKWELAAMTAVTAFLMLGTKAEAMDDAYRMPQLSGVTKTWVYQGETSDQNWERMLADDQEDGDLTSVIKSSGSVNTSKTGTYVLSRSVTDSDQHTAALDTQVTVLDRNASEEEKSIQRILYTLPDASHLTGIGFNRGYYHDRYGKLKRTYEALEHLIKETKEEIQHLESISTALDIALNEEDLVQVKEELTQYGYIRRKYTGKRVKITSKPFHYLSSDGYDIYVGKNNYQNEELTFKFATGNDWWFHAKGAPGSHVIVKAGQGLPPDRTFEEAARLAAWYSSHRGADKVEVDYVEKKQVKKVNGGKPGFVIYHTNYSMVIDSDISGIRQVKEK